MRWLGGALQNFVLSETVKFRGPPEAAHVAFAVFLVEDVPRVDLEGRVAAGELETILRQQIDGRVAGHFGHEVRIGNEAALGAVAQAAAKRAAGEVTPEEIVFRPEREHVFRKRGRRQAPTRGALRSCP